MNRPASALCPPYAQRGSAATIIITLGGLLAASAFGVVIFKPAAPAVKPLTQSQLQEPRVLPGDLRLALYDLGLSPENLSAAGVSARAVQQIVADLAGDLAVSLPALNTARENLASARQTKDAIVRAIQSGQATEQDRAVYRQVLANYTAAQTNMSLARDGLFNRAAASLSPQQRQTIQMIKANKAWDLPTEYLVAARSESDWLALRDAWAAQRFALSQHQAVPDVAAGLIQRAGQDPAVAAAMNGLAALQAVRTAWDAAIEQP